MSEKKKLYESYWKQFLTPIKKYLNQPFPNSFEVLTSQKELLACGQRSSENFSFVINTNNSKILNKLSGSAPARDFRKVIVENRDVQRMLYGRKIDFKHSSKNVLTIIDHGVNYSNEEHPKSPGELTRICNTVNELLIKIDGPIALFQKERSSKQHRQQMRSSMFDSQTIFEKEHYAFHYGGRNELQFNIGMDEYGGRSVFRYGIAFSLAKNRSTLSIDHFYSLIDRFNEFIEMHAQYFNHCKMWMWTNEGRTAEYSPRKIQANHIEKRPFIFIGQRINKHLDEIDFQDIKQIVNEFNYLYSVYDYIQLNNKKPVLPKLAKICWNDKEWKEPSGLAGKSKSKNSYERKNGFGHEEWLFDYSKQYGNYQYGGLQPINKTNGKYAGQFFDIMLYTVNSDTKKRYWVSLIKNVEVLTKKQIENAVSHYAKKGYLVEMRKQVKIQKGKTKAFNRDIDYLINIRFKPENVTTFGDELKEFDENEKIDHTRYTLLYQRPIPELLNPTTQFEEGLILDDKRKPGTSGKGRNQTAKFIPNKERHEKIQKGLITWLKKKQDGKVYAEPTQKAAGTRIDVFYEKDNGVKVFYEVKSYDNVRHSIRVALGQLLEYAYYPTQQLADEIVVVTHKEPTPLDIKYITHLNKIFPTIKLSYMQYHLDSNQITEY